MKKLTTYDYYLWICLIYWIFIMFRLFSRQYLEMGDTFSFLIYSFFIITHFLVLTLRYLLRNKEKVLRIITSASILPSIVTGIFMMISIFFEILSLTK
jgi:hypothetical protein